MTFNKEDWQKEATKQRLAEETEKINRSAWIQFAAAVMTTDEYQPHHTAVIADLMLIEFKKRDFK